MVAFNEIYATILRLLMKEWVKKFVLSTLVCLGIIAGIALLTSLVANLSILSGVVDWAAVGSSFLNTLPIACELSLAGGATYTLFSGASQFLSAAGAKITALPSKIAGGVKKIFNGKPTHNLDKVNNKMQDIDDKDSKNEKVKGKNSKDKETKNKGNGNNDNHKDEKRQKIQNDKNSHKKKAKDLGSLEQLEKILTQQQK